MATGVAQRLPRLLALVPYLLARPGAHIDEVAADFGVTPTQLQRDLELLWMCGLPGYGPGDLIDLSFEGDTVSVTFDAGMNRPLRLAGQEATALVVALRALAETPGVVDADAVQRALAKIEAATGRAQASAVVVGLANREEAATRTVREALDAGVALRLRYYTASRDAITDRVVDPMRFLLVDGRGYLEAWCRSAEAVRLFRLDRIEELTRLDEPAAPPPDARPTDVSAGLFRPAPDQRVAELAVAADARWVAEYYPTEELTEADDGGAVVRMRYSDPAWLERLVLGLGPAVTVLDPPELAAAVAERAEQALHRIGSARPGATVTG